jgi:LPXTG-site transpeptidase (sortase) family protein
MKHLSRTKKIIGIGIILIVVAFGASLLTNTLSIINPGLTIRATVRDVDLVIPTRLKIPSIGVDAAVEHVGVNNVGNMEIPQDWRNVAWYELGFTPGENGNAVFAGHLDWDKNQAVFWDLDELTSGDLVFVEGDNGRLTYIVTSVREYDYRADTADIFGPSDDSQIRLITCDGDFLEGSDTYQKRFVVTGELVLSDNEEVQSTNEAMPAE